ncbi:LacI family DNA-binding transcriptional regulator [Actibacterium sp. 188UL27-1]|uniref:LacI family DNA-binding transcriptional regulator n=1 Tax=Actibacterium sp. 188UL27-1 TaxID=2786961 RepID=UPI00195A25D9|nr:LacI family DNA-binding transcriptional regulator [Actibacterium sp. 188UL27-1]MBM7069650.1 LacI family DNA-binding transcriptional regulator [Actibacterium sp. 188UL27-1]
MVKQTVGLKTLAAHLNVTVGTVSRALNGYSDISEATRLRVLRAADELGYRPNHAARRLSTGVAEAVAYVMPQYSSSISQPFVGQLLKGLGEAVAKRGWDLLVAHADSAKDELNHLDRLVRSGRVGGLVISRPAKNDPRIRLMRSLKCPFVVHGRTADCRDYAWYDVDGADAFHTAVDHLVTLGHGRIAFVGAPLQYQFAQDRLNGYRAALEQNGLRAVPEFVQITEFSDDGGELATNVLLDLDQPPSAIVCISDMVALGALAAIRARGLTPGRDISVIGYDGLKVGQHANPPLTTMAQPQVHAGRRLGDILLAIIDGGDPRDYQDLQKAHLLRRKTDGAFEQTT